MTPQLHPLTVPKLKELIICDSEKGELFWKPRTPQMFKKPFQCETWNNLHAGKPALDTVHSMGYLCGKILDQTYLTHRVIYAMHHGVWPLITDHINGERTDNRIINLRSVTAAENQRNQRLYKNNKSGHTGVFSKGQSWYAHIRNNGKFHYLGKFTTLEDAVTARKKAERAFDFHINHGRIAC